MSLYRTVRDKILKNKKIREEGGYVGVPIPHKRLSDYYPCLEPGHSVGILGATGVAKSRYGRFLGVYTPYAFYKETGYKVKVFYLPLEDNKEKVYMNMICHYLWEKHQILVSLQELQSKGSRALPDWIADHLMDEAEEYFEEFEKIVTVIDGFTTPSQIEGMLERYFLKMGEVIDYEVEVEGEMIAQSRYESDIHVIILIDNYSNIDMDEGDKSERQTVVDFAKKVVRERFCNFYRATAIQVLQTDFQTERQQFGSSDGKSIMAKVEPTLASIGDAKTVARSMHVIVSLFDPSRYEFLTYPLISKSTIDKDPTAASKVYNIEVLGNKFRALKVLKNNDSDSGIRVGLLFNALAETWEELPAADSKEMQKFYDEFENSGGGLPVKTKTQITKLQIAAPEIDFDPGEEEDDDMPF